MHAHCFSLYVGPIKTCHSIGLRPQSIIVIKRDKSKINSIETVERINSLAYSTLVLVHSISFSSVFYSSWNWIKHAKHRTENRMYKKMRLYLWNPIVIEALLLDWFIVIYSFFLLQIFLNLCYHPAISNDKRYCMRMRSRNSWIAWKLNGEMLYYGEWTDRHTKEEKREKKSPYCSKGIIPIDVIVIISINSLIFEPNHFEESELL